LRKKQSIPGSGPKVPGYIVTFSDMVTLLLTFFVMLLSLATTQDPDLFHVGRDSFVRAIKGYGLGVLWGKQQAMNFENIKPKYEIENPEQLVAPQTLDAQQERAKRAFEKVQQYMKTMPSQVTGRKIDLPSLDISFEPQSAKLNESAKIQLTEFCTKLQYYPDLRALRLYALGLMEKTAPNQENWTLAALRAKAVADFVVESALAGKNIPVYSWAAGSEENQALSSKTSHVRLIAFQQ